MRGHQEAIRRIPLHYDHIGSSQYGAIVLVFPPGLLTEASEPGQGFSGLVYVIEGRLDLQTGGISEMLDAGDFRVHRNRHADHLGLCNAEALPGVDSKGLTSRFVPNNPLSIGHTELGSSNPPDWAHVLLLCGRAPPELLPAAVDDEQVAGCAGSPQDLCPP